MLKLTVKEKSLFNEETEKFIDVEETEITLEHSLASVSKWEQITEKAFLGKDQRTDEETRLYIKCMVISPEDISDNVILALTSENMTTISNYINAKMTATWFSDRVKGGANTGEIITAEVMYYWLVALQIDWQVQYWHLNTMLTLVKVTNIKNDPKKKLMPKLDADAERARLNAERKARMNSKG